MRIFYRYVKTSYKTIITNNFEGRFTTRCHLRYFSFTAVSGIPERFYVTMVISSPFSPVSAGSLNCY